MSKKKKIEDLAIFSGRQAFSEPLHVNTPNFGNEELFSKLVWKILETRRFTNDGPFVQRLSREIEQYLGVKHCILTNNGTQAMALLVNALELRGKVIIPSFTFISTAHTLATHGLTPVFCDINPQYWGIDPIHCESLITEDTSAIIATHLWGLPCEIEKFQKLAAKYNLELIFDAAHAFGNTYQGDKIGRYGTAEVFSFHATKSFHTFEGGAITTQNAALAAKLSKMRNFGFSDYDRVDILGTNAKMPEICAAAGLANLVNINKTFEKNQSVYQKYHAALRGIEGINLIQLDLKSQENAQYIVCRIEQDKIGLSRDEVVTILQHEGILARRYFFPGNHRMEPFLGRYPEVHFDLPWTNKLCSQVLVLPAGSTVSLADVEMICGILVELATKGWQMRKMLSPGSVHVLESEPLNKLAKVRQCVNRNTEPSVEIRIPISANTRFLRQVNYFLKSLQLYGGPLGKKAKCVLIASRDSPYQDLSTEYSWLDQYNVDVHWAKQDLFDKYHFHGTIAERLQFKSEADVVILLDADVLICGPLDDIIKETFRFQKLSGFIAHVSPFEGQRASYSSNKEWWSEIFARANLDLPPFENMHTGWGLFSKNKKFRSCPFYFNHGFIIAPRRHFDQMGSTFTEDLDIVGSINESYFKSQIANTLSFVRHDIPCETLSINYNFPLHVSDYKMRALNPDANGHDSPDDIKVFHYLGQGEFNRKDFDTTETIEKALKRQNLRESSIAFQRKLQIIHDKIQKDISVDKVNP